MKTVLIKNKVVKNASWIIGCKIFQAVLSLIVTMLTARYLGPSNYGIISYAASVVAFFIPVMQLGLSNVLVQETIQHPEEEGKIFGSALTVGIVGSVACIFGNFAFVATVNAGQTDTIIVCVLYSLILTCQAFELIQYWYQAKYLSKYSSIVSLCAYVIVSAYKIFLLISQKSIYWFALSNAIDYLLIAISLLVIYKIKGGQRLQFSWQVTKRMVSVSRYYIVSSLMVTIFAQTDKIMLTLMVDDAATGYYSAAVACAGITSFVFVAIIDSARPAILESRKISVELFEKNMSRLYCTITYLSLAQSIAMTVFARLVITLLYGSHYEPAIPALQLIVWYTTFSYYGSVRNIWILAEGKQKYLWIINLLGALTNVVLNAMLIPVLGILGASFASLVTQIFTNVIIGIIIKPIRRNNVLMLQGLNPTEMIKIIMKTLKVGDRK